MSCFSVNDPFLTTFYYVENEKESNVRIRGRGLKNLTYPYMRVWGVKNCQNHPYVVNGWPLSVMFHRDDYYMSYFYEFK